MKQGFEFAPGRFETASSALAAGAWIRTWIGTWVGTGADREAIGQRCGTLMSWCADSSLARLSTVLLAVSLSGVGSGASAQSLEPRTYSNTPVGMNFLIVGYGYGTGGVVADASLQLENASLQTHGPLLAYARALDVWGKSGKIDIVLPYA